MDITVHCRERYVERIIGIDNKKEIKEYAKEHLKELEDEITNLYKNGQPVYYGKIGRARQDSSYILNKDIVMVLNSKEDIIVTLYKVDFGFPDKTNKKVLNDLMKELKNINNEINNMKTETANKNKIREVEIENLNLSIKAFETKIDVLEAKKKVLYQEKEADEKTIESINAERDRLCKMICNSLDYKLDLLVM